MKGSGTLQEPYLVETAEDLDNVRNDLSAHYKQISDIDLSGYTNWLPIGMNEDPENDYDFFPGDKSEKFEGDYDGNGYKITNLNMFWEIQRVGLFAWFDWAAEATIKNLTIENFDIVGGGDVGVIAAWSYHEIKNCHTKNGRVESRKFEHAYTDGNYVGGLVSGAEGEVLDCTVENVEVIGDSIIGGFISWHGNFHDIGIRNCHAKDIKVVAANGGFKMGGFAQDIDCDMENCSVSGKLITSSNRIGGFVASFRTAWADETIQVKNCYSRVDIVNHSEDVEQEVGGFACDIHEADLINCYYAGKMESEGASLFGFVSNITNPDNTTITNCYWDKELSEVTQSDGGEPRTTEEMTYPYDAETTYIDWDFENVWYIYSDINDGYPVLEEHEVESYKDVGIVKEFKTLAHSKGEVQSFTTIIHTAYGDVNTKPAHPNTDISQERDNAIFKVGNEVSDNDVNIMYYETPNITPNKTLNAIDNVGVIQDIKTLKTGYIAELMTDEEGVLVDEDGDRFKINDTDFTITNRAIEDEENGEDTPVYYSYNLRYNHISDGNLSDEITLYLNNEVYDRDDYFVIAEQVAEGIYDIEIYTSFKDSDNEIYEIEYNPEGVYYEDYREFLNLTSIFTRVYHDDPAEEEYYILKEEDGSYILTSYTGSETEDEYHTETKTFYDSVDLDYNASLEGYKASEGKGLYVLFFLDASKFMYGSSHYGGGGYRTLDVASNMTSRIIDVLLEEEITDKFDIRYQVCLFNNEIGINYHPSIDSWYDETTNLSKSDIRDGFNYFDIVNDAYYAPHLCTLTEHIDNITDNLSNSISERSGYKTLFVLLSNLREESAMHDDGNINEQLIEEYKHKIYQQDVEKLWSFLTGSHKAWSNSAGYTEEEVEYVQALGSSNRANYLVVNRYPEDDPYYNNSMEDEDALEIFNDSGFEPQKILHTIEDDIYTIQSSVQTPRTETFLEISGDLPGHILAPYHLRFICEAEDPCLDIQYYFGDTETEEPFDLEYEHIDYSEV